MTVGGQRARVSELPVYDSIDEMSLDELRDAWVRLGTTLESMGEAWLRQALKCALYFTADAGHLSAPDQQALSRFMEDIELLLGCGGEEFIHSVIRSFGFPAAVTIEELDVREYCRRMFATCVLEGDSFAADRASDMYGGGVVEARDCAPSLLVMWEDVNPGLRSGFGELSVAASKAISKGLSFERAASLWNARAQIGDAYRPSTFECIEVIYWAARTLCGR